MFSSMLSIHKFRVNTLYRFSIYITVHAKLQQSLRSFLNVHRYTIYIDENMYNFAKTYAVLAVLITSQKLLSVRAVNKAA